VAGDVACIGRGSARGGRRESLPVTLTYRGTGDTSYGPSSDAPREAGTYELTVTTVGDQNNAGASAVTPVVILDPPTPSALAYSGRLNFVAADATTSTVDVVSSANVRAPRGSLASATVTLTSSLAPSGIPGCVNLPVQPTSATTGSVECRWSATIPKDDAAAVIRVVATMDGNAGPAEDVAVVTVVRPGVPGVLTGGGRTVLKNTVGAYASAESAPTSYGFNIVLTDGANARGRFELTVHAGQRMYQFEVHDFDVPVVGTDTVTLTGRATEHRWREGGLKSMISSGPDLRVHVVIGLSDAGDTVATFLVTDSRGGVLLSGDGEMPSAGKSATHGGGL
jgi:hypothetical protein